MRDTGFFIGALIAGTTYMIFGYLYVRAFAAYVRAIQRVESGVESAPKTFYDNIKFQLFALRTYRKRYGRPESDPSLEALRLRAKRRDVWRWVAFFLFPVVMIVLGIIFRQ